MAALRPRETALPWRTSRPGLAAEGGRPAILTGQLVEEGADRDGPVSPWSAYAREDGWIADCVTACVAAGEATEDVHPWMHEEACGRIVGI